MFTPDGDMVEEDVTASKVVQVCSVARVSPRGVRASRSYRFSEPFYSEPLLDRPIAAGEEMAALLYDAQTSQLLLADMS